MPTLPFLGDAHAHLESYEPEALETMIDRARDSGVGIIIGSGITLRSSATSVDIAKRYDFMWATVGLHPWYADRLASRVESVTELAARERVVGIGEIGLDFLQCFQDRQTQMALFEAQLRLARARELPVVVHTYGALRETQEAIIRSKAHETGVIIQGFIGDLATLEGWIDLGAYISVGVRMFRKPAEAVAEVVPRIPSERLLIETDAAAARTVAEGLDLTTLRTIAERVAAVRGVTLEEIARTTTANLKKVYHLVE
ncbi:MAG: TatD family hydrolase [Chloroflexi bacterium]|nr:TatD family hydrolase [Chloroflexota bacterium]